MSPPRVRLEVGIQDNIEFEVRNERVEFLADGFRNRLLLETAQFTPANCGLPADRPHGATGKCPWRMAKSSGEGEKSACEFSFRL